MIFISGFRKILTEYRRKKFVAERNRLIADNIARDYVDQSFLDGKLAELEKKRPRTSDGTFICDACQVMGTPEIQRLHLDGTPIEYASCSYCGHNNLDEIFRQHARSKRYAAVRYSQP
jgi:hypothetical protein